MIVPVVVLIYYNNKILDLKAETGRMSIQDIYKINRDSEIIKITHEQSVGLELEDRSWNGIIGELILYRKDIL